MPDLPELYAIYGHKTPKGNRRPDALYDYQLQAPPPDILKGE